MKPRFRMDAELRHLVASSYDAFPIELVLQSG